MHLSFSSFATALAAIVVVLAYRIFNTAAPMSSSLLKTLVVPAASGKATASVIFAHGLGDSGLGWLDVAQMLSRRPALRHVRFVLPNAPVQPVTLNMGMAMPSWFDIVTLEDINGSEDEKGLLKSAGEIKKLVQAEVDGTGDGLNGHKIPAERVVVGGFSQGGAISYLAGLTMTTPVAGIIALSTWLPLRSKLPSMVAPHASSLPVFHGHGDADQIVQFSYGERTVDFLRDGSNGLGLGEFKTEGGKAQGVRFEIYKRMQHSACPEEIEHVGQFLENVVSA